MEGGKTLTEKEKDKKIRKEFNKYKKKFGNLEKDKKEFVEDLCQQAAFMKMTLLELQEDINVKGAVVTATNGNGFEVTSENPSQKSYNTMIKNYNATLKTLVELLPELEEDDEMMNFIKGKGK